MNNHFLFEISGCHLIPMVAKVYTFDRVFASEYFCLSEAGYVYRVRRYVMSWGEEHFTSVCINTSPDSHLEYLSKEKWEKIQEELLRNFEKGEYL